MERKVCFILDAGNQKEEWWMPVQRLTPLPDNQGGFYRRREGVTCRNSTVTSDSPLQSDHRWSDQCHLDCLKYN